VTKVTTVKIRARHAYAYGRGRGGDRLNHQDDSVIRSWKQSDQTLHDHAILVCIENWLAWISFADAAPVENELKGQEINSGDYPYSITVPQEWQKLCVQHVFSCP
jgi:hypothetical protein